ncbi:MAG: three-Cys-motif partner protein TcmP [Pseudohongiellaceae bacterium]
MPPKNSHITSTVGPWAKQKLNGLQAYLHAYTTALKKTSFELIYIDGFAGTGSSMVRNAPNMENSHNLELLGEDEDFVVDRGNFIEGSPRRALNLELPFDRYFFFDTDVSRVDLLDNLKTEFPDRKIIVDTGDANDLICKLMPQIGQGSTRGVAFLDPYGPHVEWRTLEALGKTGKFEAIINFPLGMAINRLITIQSEDIPDNWRAMLDKCFGSNEWESLVYEQQSGFFYDETVKVSNASQRLLDHYIKNLKKVFKYVSTPSLVKNTQGAPLYYMIWVGPHSLGLKIADYILKKGELINPP